MAIRNFINMVVLPTRLFAFSFGSRTDHLYPALSSRQRCRGLLINLTLVVEDANSVQPVVDVDVHANIGVDFDVHDYFDVDNYILKLDMLAAFV